jgi:hypothetical protein
MSSAGVAAAAACADQQFEHQLQLLPHREGKSMLPGSHSCMQGTKLVLPLG